MFSQLIERLADSRLGKFMEDNRGQLDVLSVGFAVMAVFAEIALLLNSTPIAGSELQLPGVIVNLLQAATLVGVLMAIVVAAVNYNATLALLISIPAFLAALLLPLYPAQPLLILAPIVAWTCIVAARRFNLLELLEDFENLPAEKEQQRQEDSDREWANA